MIKKNCEKMSRSQAGAWQRGVKIFTGFAGTIYVLLEQYGSLDFFKGFEPASQLSNPLKKSKLPQTELMRYLNITKKLKKVKR